jgi:hypothetical protein
VGWLDDLFEQLVTNAARRLSGRAMAAVCLALYGGIGLVLPLALRWPASWLAAANVVGTGMAVLLLIAWIGERVQQSRRRNLLEWTSDLRKLDATEFEWFVGELLRREGWEVEEVGRPGMPDGNVDLRLRRGRVVHIVQCKRWQSRPVGVDEVRELAGTLMREGLGGAAGVYVTLSEFTPQAREEAGKIGMELLGGTDLYPRVEKVRRAEVCKKCHKGMVLDRSVHGWWLRCVTPGCGGKRDLGRDPGRAIDLLTLPPE